MSKIRINTFTIVAGLLMLLAVVSMVLFRLDSAIGASAVSSSRQAARHAPNEVVTEGDKVVRYDAKGDWLATFTKGARTVTVRGPERTFSEPGSTPATVTSSTWVRLYPQPFTGTIDEQWLQRAIKDNVSGSNPDVLQIAMQYIAKAPTVRDANGVVIATDASYGPLLPNGSRQEGADYNDFLGIDERYGARIDKPEPAQKGDLDCSGFQRMVWGYRSGLPLGFGPDADGNVMPRRAFQMLGSAPGVIIMPDTGKQITDLSKLQAGDLVFHDASHNDGAQIDHVGIYMGVDSQGHRRFISSRKTADGPTFGDVGGKSVLDGKGLYAKSFRAVRRL